MTIEIVTGPPAAMIGWIPRLAAAGDPFPAGVDDYVSGRTPIIRRRSFLQTQVQRELAFRGLFWSGDPAPPSNLGDLNGYRTFVSQERYRLAIAIWSIQAIWENDRPRLDRNLAFHYDAGFTPVRIPLGNQGFLVLTRSHGVAQTRRIRVLSKSPTHIEFEFRLDVKLSKWIDLLQTPINYTRAPWARGGIRYTLYRDGTGHVQWGGSYICRTGRMQTCSRPLVRHFDLPLSQRRRHNCVHGSSFPVVSPAIGLCTGFRCRGEFGPA
jgi:hypothetical protein